MQGESFFLAKWKEWTNFKAWWVMIPLRFLSEGGGMVDLVENSGTQSSGRVDELFDVGVETFHLGGNCVAKVGIFINETREKSLFESQPVFKEIS